MSLIKPRLYLGNWDNAQDYEYLKNWKITHILWAAGELKLAFPDKFIYMKLNASDIPTYDILKDLDKAADFIEEGLSINGVVFVHWFAGISRSASCIIAYMIKYERWESVKLALSFIKKSRPCVKPNSGFKEQLQSYNELWKERPIPKSKALTIRSCSVVLNGPNSKTSKEVGPSSGLALSLLSNIGNSRNEKPYHPTSQRAMKEYGTSSIKKAELTKSILVLGSTNFMNEGAETQNGKSREVQNFKQNIDLRISKFQILEDDDQPQKKPFKRYQTSGLVTKYSLIKKSSSWNYVEKTENQLISHSYSNDSHNRIKKKVMELNEVIIEEPANLVLSFDQIPTIAELNAANKETRAVEEGKEKIQSEDSWASKKYSPRTFSPKSIEEREINDYSNSNMNNNQKASLSSLENESNMSEENDSKQKSKKTNKNISLKKLNIKPKGVSKDKSGSKSGSVTKRTLNLKNMFQKIVPEISRFSKALEATLNVPRSVQETDRSEAVNRNEPLFALLMKSRSINSDHSNKNNSCGSKTMKSKFEKEFQKRSSLNKKKEKSKSIWNRRSNEKVEKEIWINSIWSSKINETTKLFETSQTKEQVQDHWKGVSLYDRGISSKEHGLNIFASNEKNKNCLNDRNKYQHLNIVNEVSKHTSAKNGSKIVKKVDQADNKHNKKVEIKYTSSISNNTVLESKTRPNIDNIKTQNAFEPLNEIFSKKFASLTFADRGHTKKIKPIVELNKTLNNYSDRFNKFGKIQTNKNAIKSRNNSKDKWTHTPVKKLIENTWNNFKLNNPFNKVKPMSPERYLNMRSVATQMKDQSWKKNQNGSGKTKYRQPLNNLSFTGSNNSKIKQSTQSSKKTLNSILRDKKINQVPLNSSGFLDSGVDSRKNWLKAFTEPGLNIPTWHSGVSKSIKIIQTNQFWMKTGYQSSIKDKKQNEVKREQNTSASYSLIDLYGNNENIQESVQESNAQNKSIKAKFFSPRRLLNHSTCTPPLNSGYATEKRRGNAWGLLARKQNMIKKIVNLADLQWSNSDLKYSNGDSSLKEKKKVIGMKTNECSVLNSRKSSNSKIISLLKLKKK